MTHLKVNFDNFTHNTGHLRCFLYCKMHKNYRIYVFLKDFVSRERAVSYLFAWAAIGAVIEDPDHGALHVAEKPDDEMVNIIQREQFGM